MQQLNLSEKVKRMVFDFTGELKNIYPEDLDCVILYGSAASGEFIDKSSDLNLLVVLKSAEPDNLAKASGLVNKPRFKTIHSLFLSREYVQSSLDVFPIEFLDMKENYQVLAGNDVLRDASVDIKNLRFQCEHELKSRLISLQQAFLSLNKNHAALKQVLFKSFTSALHILRNVLRIKGKAPRYLKQDTIKQIKEEFPVSADVWEKVLAAKNKQISLSGEEVRRLFIVFMQDLSNISRIVDRL